MQPSVKTALVTGASSGIGRCFAQRLAAMGADLVITARREERLEELAADLRARFGVEVSVVALDLSNPEAAQALYEKTEGAGLAVDVLINNAGIGAFSPFGEIPWERTQEQLRLNVMALTELSWRFGRAMGERGRGYILNVASFIAYLPVPYYATYAASKAYVVSFSQALAAEMRGKGVRVLSLSPGGVATEFWAVAGQPEVPGLVKRTLSSPDKVARVGLRALLRGRRSLAVGIVTKLGVFFIGLLPRRLVTWAAGRVVAKTRH